MTHTYINRLESYPFSNSLSFTGDYELLSIPMSSRKFIRNSNFVLNGGRIHIKNMDGMFEGCINAAFTANLSIPSNTISSTASAFKDCEKAKIPFVDISGSSITRCDHMFENCYSAELQGVTIPSGAVKFNAMFKNAKSAMFIDISRIPSAAPDDRGIVDYSELFCGCESGTFPNLTFDEGIVDTLDCSYMFYYCGSMDSGSLDFDNVSEYVGKGDYMFYSAGANGSTSMDDCVFRFGRLSSCENMFTNSNFSFSNSFFRFFRSGDGSDSDHTHSSTITSLAGLFAGCRYCTGRSPAIVLGSSSETMEASSMDERLNYRLRGYYSSDFSNAIIDFSGLYEGSSFTTLDLRGICNNAALALGNYQKLQNFERMCKGCGSLENILGYLPPHSSSYASMFEGCSSLSIDISTMFKKQTDNNWNSMDELKDAFDGENAISTYKVKDASRMFNGCKGVYSTNDSFDLVSIFKTVRLNNSDTATALNGLDYMLPAIRLATHDPIPELYGAIYDLNGISKRSGTVRYNSFSVDGLESSMDGMEISEFGIHSDYAKRAFPRGFYRYGGTFAGEPDKCFFIIYYPEVEEGTGTVNGFIKRKPSSTYNMVPHGWNELFKTDNREAEWNDFELGDMYAGMICDLYGNFIRYAYIGNYTRIYRERKTDGTNTYVVDKRFEMPVTYFDGRFVSIEPLSEISAALNI